MFAESEYSGPKEFVHLHLHTLASSLDGVPSADQYADACLKNGFPAMAVTEHGHMASMPDLYFAFKKRNLKGLVGCELYYNDYEPLRRQLNTSGTSKKDMNPAVSERIAKNRHLTVIAKNQTGVYNLLKLSTLAWEFGFYYKPRVWFEKLCEYKEGLIVLSGCINGPISHEIRLDVANLIENKKPYSRTEHDKTATEYIKQFKKVFGEDFFIEVQMPCIPALHDARVFRKSLSLADENGVKAVLTNDCHYLVREDSYIQKVMMAIEQGLDIYDNNLFSSDSDEQFFKTRAELWATFKNNDYSKGIDDRKFEEICNNTLLIADKCEKLAPDTSPKIPNWSSVERGVNENDELRRIVYEQLKKRGWDKDQRKWMCDGREVTYKEQADIELDRFIDKGFSSYFLITRDWIEWGRKHGWPFGPRGSAAGSLVCHLLGIHNIDSLSWELSFDRFLASSRGGYQLKVKID